MPEFEAQRTQLIAELNIGHLAEDDQGRVLTALGEVVMKRVMIKVLETLPEAEREPFEKFMQADDEAAIQEMFQKYIPNISEVIQQITQDAVEEHKRLVTEIAAKNAGEVQ